MAVASFSKTSQTETSKMFLLEMIVSSVLATAIALLLTFLRPRDGAPRFVLFLFFLVTTFPLIWMAGLWMIPVGPPFGGVPWLGYILVSLFLLLFVLVVVPPSRPPRHRDDVVPADAEREAREGTAIFFGLFFWLLMVATAVALMVRYAAL
jgi:hypothetical protein